MRRPCRVEPSHWAVSAVSASAAWRCPRGLQTATRRVGTLQLFFCDPWSVAVGFSRNCCAVVFVSLWSSACSWVFAAFRARLCWWCCCPGAFPDVQCRGWWPTPCCCLWPTPCCCLSALPFLHVRPFCMLTRTRCDVHALGFILSLARAFSLSSRELGKRCGSTAQL